MTNSEPLRLAVLDCDGTMVDSQASIVAAMNAALADHDLPPAPDHAVRRVVGLDLAEAIGQLLPQSGDDLVAKVTASYRREAQQQRLSGEWSDPLYPGTIAAIEDLSAAGWLLGVATGKARRGLDHVLEKYQIGAHFSTLQTSDVALGKPHPDMLHRAMKETRGCDRKCGNDR